MTFIRSALALALSLSAGASFAQSSNAGLASTGLVATPSPITFTGRGGLYYPKTVTVTNYGPGFASNLAVTMPKNYGTIGDVMITGDTCTGATLAVGGTCQVKLGFDAGCPKAGSVGYTLTITSTSMATLYDTVTANTQTGICQ